MNDLELDEERERRETETFRRIHRLIKRGYRIDWRVTDVEDAFWLEHPGGGPDLILYPDGKIVSIDEDVTLVTGENGDLDRISNESVTDRQLFDSWLRCIRLPTWKERTAADREKYIWQPGSVVLIYVVVFGVIKLIEIAWKAASGT